MSFESVLDAAIELLKRRRRVTYRLLQREFDLDEAALADLKDELILGQRLARDEDGVVLVWSAAAEASVAERRRLTVMFCDLVGSTKLSTRLDPEDLRDVVRSYHEECAAVLRPTGGHIAQYLGDGILVYFGYPVANEDDAERAVRAGLAIVQAVRLLSTRLAARVAGGLAVRVGIHTGLVVIGDLGDANQPGTLALGEAPNIAAHIQSVATPDSVLVSQATLELLPQRFITEDLGLVVLKDPANPVRLARVAGELDALQPRNARPQLVDPAGHLRALQTAWARAAAGHGLALLVCGEAGLGKTRLGDELMAEVQAAGAPVRVLRCSAFHRHSALHPVAQHLLQRAGLNPDAPGESALGRLHALQVEDGIERSSTLPQLAALVGVEAPDTPTDPSPAALMQALQTLLVDWLSAAARTGPALMLWEDVHWADPTTLALLKRLLEGGLPPGLLLVLTTRPDFTPPWRADAVAKTLVLERMGVGAIRHVIQQVAGGRALAPALVDRIVHTAEGVPLYAEQITRSVLDSATDAVHIEVPATLHASLMARLDRMGPAKAVAQTAALLGREFSPELLAAVCALPRGELERSLQQLTQGDVLQTLPDLQPPRYAFRHALLQVAAGESLLRTARQQTHARIAQVLRGQFPETVDAAPETLARHVTEAGDTDEALALWRRAGEHALARSAVAEAVSHLQTGLDLLPQLPAGRTRDTTELGLQVLLASALRAGQGVAAPATGAAYERASALARELGDRPRLIPALNGLYSYHLVRGRCDEAQAPAQQLLDTARAHGDALFEMIGHRAVGAVAFHVGDPATARHHLQLGLAQYVPERHAPMAMVLGIDHKVAASNFLSLTLCAQGDDAAAMEVQRGCLAWADQLGHAHSTAQALVFYCLMLAVQENWQAIGPMAERATELGQKRGFPLMESSGRFFQAAARAMGEHATGELPQMQVSASQWWATGARNYRPLVELILARVQAQAGDMQAARQLLRAAHGGVAASGERWIEPELWRLQGELLAEHRENDLRRALELARRQGASGFEQRAQRSMAAHSFS
jgi:class 3 adenylate cyclase/predicted ATPase